MKLYFWKCQKCGLTFDRVTKGEPRICPQCRDKGYKTFIGAKMIPVCPYCKRTNEVYRNVRAYGWCEEHFDGNGNQTSIETNGLQFTDGKTFRCVNCGKIRINPLELK